MLIALKIKENGSGEEECELLDWPSSVGNPFADGGRMGESLEKSMIMEALEEANGRNDQPGEVEVNHSEEDFDGPVDCDIFLEYYYT